MILRGPLSLDPARHRCLWNGEDVTLTVTEFLLLEALAQRPGHVKNRDQLMDAAYDDNVYVDDRTIDSHIKRLRKKFKQVDDDFDAIERSEEHTSELQSLMRISYAVFCLKKKTTHAYTTVINHHLLYHIILTKKT